MSTSAPGGGNGPGVFIVDDEAALREIYSDFLPIRGYSIVGLAENGEDAVRAITSLEQRPDLIVMDHRMPRKSGVDATRELLDKDPHLAILFVTADAKVGKEAVAAGARGVLVKPFAMDDLFVAVSNAIKLTK